MTRQAACSGHLYQNVMKQSFFECSNTAQSNIGNIAQSDRSEVQGTGGRPCKAEELTLADAEVVTTLLHFAI